MSPAAIQWTAVAAGVAAGIIYYSVLARASKDNRLFFKTLWILASVIFCLNWVTDAYVLTRLADGPGSNFFSVGVISALHSLEIFVFQTHFFDTGYQEYFFGQDPLSRWMMYTLVVLSVLAGITSVALLIRALNRRRAGRAWLASHSQSPGQAHVFFLGGVVSRVVAADIRRTHPDHTCIFIGYPDPEEADLELSIWEKIKRLFQSRTEEEDGVFHARVYSRIPLQDVDGPDVCRQLGLQDLQSFLDSPSCKVYLLGDDEQVNLRCTEILYNGGCQAEIFCRACREGVNSMYEEAMTTTPRMKVHLVDSSYLAVRNIRNTPELLPVNYVEKGKDAQGRLEGWVETPFHAAILGFGETGREALSFLYESGSFVDQDYGRNGFSCVVYDDRMAELEQAYLRRYPGMGETAGIHFRNCRVGGNDFWKDMDGRIASLNYVVVALGDDRTNLRVAIDLAECALRRGKDLSRNFAILIAQQLPTELDKVTLAHYNTIGRYQGCIKPFGTLESVWTYDNITNESLLARAKAFYASYMRAEDSQVDAEANWEKREVEIREATDYALYAKRMRQRSQDFANCFHIATKRALMGPEIYDRRKEVAASIPADFKHLPDHYLGEDPYVEKFLGYMAVQEHVRWETSHVAMGYVPGARTDEVLKTHVFIARYEDLSPKIQHYDYLMVKATLELV